MAAVMTAMALDPIHSPRTRDTVTPPMEREHSEGYARFQRTPTSGSGRAWTEDEEAYLMQTRLRKMPYKHIAAHLNKTELACRLHYHQLSHGSNRRRRRSSHSGGPATSPQSRYAAQNAPQTPKAASPPSYTPASPQSAASQPADRDMSPPMTATNSIFPRLGSISSIANNPGHLRVECKPRPVHLDRERLRQIYESRKAEFWAAIAHEYQPGTDPRLAEDVFKQTVVFPLTPAVSPDNRCNMTPTAAAAPVSRYTHSAQSSTSSMAEPASRRFSVPPPPLRKLNLCSATVPPTPGSASYSAQFPPPTAISSILSHPSTPHARDLPPPTPSRPLDSPISFLNANPFATASSRLHVSTPSPPPDVKVDARERERELAETTLAPLREGAYTSAPSHGPQRSVDEKST